MTRAPTEAAVRIDTMEPLAILFFVVVALVLSIEAGVYVLLWSYFGRSKRDRSR